MIESRPLETLAAFAISFATGIFCGGLLAVAARRKVPVKAGQ